MSQEAYPASADLTALLTQAGITLDGATVDAAIAAGIAAFERDVDRVMLAGEAETRVFDPPDNGVRLDLEGDVLPDDEDGITVAYQPLNSDPTTWTEGVDYWLKEYNAVERGRPFVAIETRRRWYTPLPFALRRSIQVTGLWGYGVTIPDDAWQAILYAGLLWLIDVAAVVNRDAFVTGWKEANSSATYGGAGVTDRISGWRALYGRTVEIYRKV